MNVIATALIAISALQICVGSPRIRSNRTDEDSNLQISPVDEERKLQSSPQVIVSSALNVYSTVPTDHILHNAEHVNNDSPGKHRYCYNEVLKAVPGGPTTAQLLVMFSDKFVEHQGKIFTVVSDAHPTVSTHGLFMLGEREIKATPIHLKGFTKGLYEVIDRPSLNPHGTCVEFELLYANPSIGQIVATSQFDPIQIIGVDKVNNRIYGYYPDPAGSTLTWKRKHTVWGDAKDGSLVTEPVDYGESAVTSGLSTNGRLFNLWGDFDYAKHDGVHCAARPAIIGDWVGWYSGLRGFYCPGVSDNQLWKYTWHSGGGQISKLGWTPAERIARLDFGSNIYGVSPQGKLLVLWEKDDDVIHSANIALPYGIGKIKSVGGSQGNIFVCDQRWGRRSRLFNVYWDTKWKMKEISLSSFTRIKASCFFGSMDGKTYLLYGKAAQPGGSHPYYPWYKHIPGKFALYRIDSAGDPDDRFKAVHIQSFIPDPVF